MAMNYYPYLTKKDVKGTFKSLTQILLLFSFRKKEKVDRRAQKAERFVF